MLKIENTKNFLGVTIKGDYQDLTAFYKAISDTTDIYYLTNLAGLDKAYKHKDYDEAMYEDYRERLEDLNDCIMGLAYDIRHAYQGDRGYEFIENGAKSILLDDDTSKKQQQAIQDGQSGNLYYSVNILYPWALYYVFYFTQFARQEYKDADFKRLYYSYDQIDYSHDISILNSFNNEIYECLKNLVRIKRANNIKKWIDSYSEFASIDNYYVEAFCHYYCNDNKRGKILHGYMLTAFVYSCLDYDGADYDLSNTDALVACDYIKQKTGQPFLDVNQFSRDIGKYTDSHGIIDDITDFIEQYYGYVDWDHLKY